MLTPLLYLVASALADPTPMVRAGEQVLVHRSAWLWTAPHRDAPRLRALPIPLAPTYTEAPARQFTVIDITPTGWIAVRAVPEPAPQNSTGQWISPDFTGQSTRGCYTPPPALAPLSATFYLRPSDLLSVLTQPTQLTLADGTHVRLEPGLLATGKDGRYRVQSMHLTLALPIPDANVGKSFVASEPPAERDFVMTWPGGRAAVDPRWSATWNALSEPVSRVGSFAFTAPVYQSADTLSDRCVKLDLAQPFDKIPVRAPGLDHTKAWPIVVPGNTTFHTTAGLQGRVAYDHVLWDVSTCTYTSAQELCCTPGPGLEFSDPDTAICFAANLPDLGAARPLQRVLDDANTDILKRFAWTQDNRPEVTIAAIRTRGGATQALVDEALEPRMAEFNQCYRERLSALQVPEGQAFFHMTLTGLARGKVLASQMTPEADRTLIDCFSRVLENSRYLALSGVSDAAFDVTFDLRLVAEPKP